MPTAPVITVAFEDVVKGFAFDKGMPNQRFTFVPHPIANIPAPTCRGYLSGNDPVTGKPIVQEIIGALTGSLTDEEKKTGFIERPIPPRLIGPDTEEKLQHLFYANGWTDGLPIVLPTEERIAKMLKGTSRRPDEVVGKMQASSVREFWSYTVEKVAVNAVMAGAKPEHFPVILAIASTGIPSLMTSTTSFARMVVVNGPIRNKIGMNAGIGALGPFNEANAVIGRAWTFLSKNLGNAGSPGSVYMGSHGNNLNYNNLCFPEKEQSLPEGWKPFHVQKGFKPEESVVSVFSGHYLIYGDALNNSRCSPPLEQCLYHELIRFMIQDFKSVGPYRTVKATLLLDPTAAKKIKEGEGFGTKEKLEQWFSENTFMPVWEYWVTYPKDFQAAKTGVEPLASWLKLPAETIIPIKKFNPPKPFEVPGRALKDPISVIVVGGETLPVWYVGNFDYITSASVDKWK